MNSDEYDSNRSKVKQHSEDDKDLSRFTNLSEPKHNHSGCMHSLYLTHLKLIGSADLKSVCAVDPQVGFNKGADFSSTLILSPRFKNSCFLFTYLDREDQVSGDLPKLTESYDLSYLCKFFPTL
jgi:hypothetical protein